MLLLPSAALEDSPGRDATSYITPANDERAGGLLQPIGVCDGFKGCEQRDV